MRITKQGIEWGPAFSEASPHKVKQDEAEFEFYLSEGYDLILQLPLSAKVEWTLKGFRVEIPND